MTNQFTINSTQRFFSNKQKILFDTLEDAERTANKNHNHVRTDMEVDHTVTEKSCNKQKDHQEQRRERRECAHPSPEFKRDSRFKQYKTRESIFKRPEAPIGRCLPHGRIPDFRKNPKLWTKYTLEDVKDEDMSDRSNTAAAFDFLRTLEKSKAQDNEEEVLAELPKKITFKKSSIVKKRHQSEVENVHERDGNGTFKSSKVLMPEYLVGKVAKRDKKKKSWVNDKNFAESSNVQLKLSHLDDDEDKNNL